MSRPEDRRPATTVRIAAAAHDQLRDLSEWRSESMQDVIGYAIDRLWREELLEDLNRHYAELREDTELWQQELAERAAWAAIEHWDDE